MLIYTKKLKIISFNYITKENLYLKKRNLYESYLKYPILSVIYRKESKLKIELRNRKHYNEISSEYESYIKQVFKVIPIKELILLEEFKLKNIFKEDLDFFNNNYIFNKIFIIPTNFIHKHENIKTNLDIEILNDKFNEIIEYLLNTRYKALPELKLFAISYFLPERHKKILLNSALELLEEKTRNKYNLTHRISQDLFEEEKEFYLNILSKKIHSFLEYIFVSHRIYVNFKNSIRQRVRYKSSKNPFYIFSFSGYKDAGFNSKGELIFEPLYED